MFEVDCQEMNTPVFPQNSLMFRFYLTCGMRLNDIYFNIDEIM